MKISMYRQPREAAIIYASTPEELHTAMLKRRRKRLQTILTLVLALVSVIVTVALVVMMKNDWAEQHKPQNAATGVHDPLRPDAVALTEELAEKVLRLHILANSDGAADQEVKLVVRDAVLAYLTEPISQCETKEQVKSVIEARLGQIVQVANDALTNAGFAYTAKAKLTTAEFPLKVYGDIFLPAGTYETLQITLGEADGQNWWCLIFPSLCLTDTLVVMQSPSENETTVSDAVEPIDQATATEEATRQTTEGTTAQAENSSIASVTPLLPTLGNALRNHTLSPNSDFDTTTVRPFSSTIVEQCSKIPSAPTTTPSTTPTSVAQTALSRETLRDALEQREYDAIQMEHEEITFEISILNLLRFLGD